jgi:cytochrome c oxidase subunit 2
MGALAPFPYIVLLLGGCAGSQSSLDPTGSDASRIWLLGAIMIVGATAILILVCASLFLAIMGSDVMRRRLASKRAIIAGGIAFPVITLTILLIYGLWTMRDTIAAKAAAPQLRVNIVGEQWWWRIVYSPNTARAFSSANELRIPIGRDVEVSLTSSDVIHSFWVPNLAGKVDMIPGRTTILHLHATRSGRFRGQCAEYCGGPHALMALEIVAMPELEFDAWLSIAATAPSAPEDIVGQRGQTVFIAAGCGTCHAIRGTPADGQIGPDLSRIGERTSIAAASLPNNHVTLGQFIKNSAHIKPGNRMPPFQFLNSNEIDGLSHYLMALK